MTNLRFVGDIPLWLGLVLALVVCVLSWRYYTRESFDLSDRLRWVLPLLRSLAFFLGIMILTGPVLHHRKEIGELGRVKIFVDASQSMGILDRHMPDSRKLLIAEQQGWLESGRMDLRRLNAANELAAIRKTAVVRLQEDEVDADNVTSMRDDVVRALQNIADQTNDDSAGAMVTSDFEPTLQQLTDEVRQISVGSDQASVDSAVSQLLTVCESLSSHEGRQRLSFEEGVQRLVLGTDESFSTALAMFDQFPRWQRAERTLLKTENALLTALKETHNVEVFALQEGEVIQLFNVGSPSEEQPHLAASPLATTSDLASGLVSMQSAALRSDTTEAEETADATAPNTAVVLLTDGQHNAGPSPFQTAKILGSQGISVYPVSLGATQQAPDIAVIGLEHPEMVFQKDRVRGTMILVDQMQPGQPFSAQVTFEGEVLWQQQLMTQNTGERRIDFDFVIDALVESLGNQFDADIKRHAVTLGMTASVTPVQNEAESANNHLPLRLAAITENYRLLILDGRSRWETRYLRNAFERDSQWDVDVIIAGIGTDQETLPRGDGKQQFPDSRDGLFDYDLIIFGEVSSELFEEHEFAWLRDYVELRGGGIIFVDGNRRRLQELSMGSLAPLLPVEWLPEEFSTPPTSLQLTETGGRTPALAFETDGTANQQFWNQLPPPHRLSHVAALPGSETLVEASMDGTLAPAVVTQTYGAGRILYLAFDETWRWRYKAADTYHQRIWNQLAKYVMPRPFAVSDEYLSVDTGGVSYDSGESAGIRVRLIGLDGKPATDATVDALLWKDGKLFATASLTADPDVPGIYRGKSGELAEGSYEVSVRASGFSQAALKARGQFVVRQPNSPELETTSCNEALLQQMAAESGGTYLREEHIGQLAELLRPLSNGRIVESETLLWQSYWWFAAIILLLTLEWFLRKRAGLL